MFLIYICIFLLLLLDLALPAKVFVLNLIMIATIIFFLELDIEVNRIIHIDKKYTEVPRVAEKLNINFLECILIRRFTTFHG